MIQLVTSQIYCAYVWRCGSSLPAPQACPAAASPAPRPKERRAQTSSALPNAFKSSRQAADPPPRARDSPEAPAARHRDPRVRPQAHQAAPPARASVIAAPGSRAPGWPVRRRSWTELEARAHSELLRSLAVDPTRDPAEQRTDLAGPLGVVFREGLPECGRPSHAAGSPSHPFLLSHPLPKQFNRVIPRGPPWTSKASPGHCPTALSGREKVSHLPDRVQGAGGGAWVSSQSLCALAWARSTSRQATHTVAVPGSAVPHLKQWSLSSSSYGLACRESNPDPPLIRRPLWFSLRARTTIRLCFIPARLHPWS